jgi:hypothetical protein
VNHVLREDWPLNANVDWEKKTVRFIVPDGSGLYVGKLYPGSTQTNAMQAENDALRSDIRILIERLRFLSPKPENVGGVSVTHVFSKQLSPFTLKELTK